MLSNDGYNRSSFNSHPTGSHRNYSFVFEPIRNASQINGTNFKHQLAVWYGVSMTFCGLGGAMCIMLMGAVWEHWQVSKRKIGRDRSGTRLLIVHATAVELIMCCINHPVSFTQILYGQYPVTPTGCIFLQLPFAIFRTAGYWSSAFLAFNRFAAVCFPAHFRAYWTKQMANTSIIFINWFICGAMYVPVILGWISRFEMTPPLNACSVKAITPEAGNIHQVLTT
ncbi:uncharacterized protein LOC129594642 [Paramacrobiotus metropolitanus]|uniref:uncharacterized protein LOC129594642 n=1 Tax=Paramacrobiotus metropolitanus TaxID=2943436 RepID=UPI002445E8FF|nr:uncharacterized protein LOC129594642 [Paramacrobiotus metropolitanus]